MSKVVRLVSKEEASKSTSAVNVVKMAFENIGAEIVKSTIEEGVFIGIDNEGKIVIRSAFPDNLRLIGLLDVVKSSLTLDMEE